MYNDFLKGKSRKKNKGKRVLKNQALGADKQAAMGNENFQKGVEDGSDLISQLNFCNSLK